jgi:hypothetical protein
LLLERSPPTGGNTPNTEARDRRFNSFQECTRTLKSSATITMPGWSRR